MKDDVTLGEKLILGVGIGALIAVAPFAMLTAFKPGASVAIQACAETISAQHEAIGSQQRLIELQKQLIALHASPNEALAGGSKPEPR